MVIDLTPANFDAVIGQPLPVVIDFFATWCGPCKKIAPYFEELAQEHEGKVVVARCNVDDSEELAVKYGIRNVPTTLFIKDGEKKDKLVGAAPKSAFEEKLQALL